MFAGRGDCDPHGRPKNECAVHARYARGTRTVQTKKAPRDARLSCLRWESGPLLAEREFESRASTNSATRALGKEDGKSSARSSRQHLGSTALQFLIGLFQQSYWPRQVRPQPSEVWMLSVQGQVLEPLQAPQVLTGRIPQWTRQLTDFGCNEPERPSMPRRASRGEELKSPATRRLTKPPNNSQRSLDTKL